MNSRFKDDFVHANYHIDEMTGPAGGGFLFDTNSIHAAKKIGSVGRTTVQLEVRWVGEWVDGCVAYPSRKRYGI